MTAITTNNFFNPIQDLFALGGTLTVKGLTKQQFKEYAALYPEFRMEQEKNGNINIMAPVKGGSGIREDKLNYRLRHWQMQNGETFSPSTGFDLPNGATKSPDASWISSEKMETLTADQIENEYIPVVPDFVVELRSKTDRLAAVKRKMEKTWIANGVRLAWLIDPYNEKVYIYRDNSTKETVVGFDRKISGESVLAGFELDLSEFKLFKKK